MDLKVLAVPDCPNVALLEQLLAQVVEGCRDVTVSRQVIADQDEAARCGMRGSPTILVDGIDPFAEPGEPASVSCRLYRDGNGPVDGAPSVSQLRKAIDEAAATATEAGTLHQPAPSPPHLPG
jgi:predicted DsbA family dithiol-disulfide isomerase